MYLEVVPGVSVTLQMPLFPPMRILGLHLIACKPGLPVEFVPDAIVRTTRLLKPLYEAVTTAKPSPPGCTESEKATVAEPGGTITEAGIAIPGLPLDRFTVTPPAELDMFTVQEMFAPALGVVVGQVMDDTFGGDKSLRSADCEEDPRVAVIAALASFEIFPAVTLNVVVALPAGTTTMPGTVMNGQFVLSVRAVATDTACDRVAVHVLVLAAIRLVGKHPTELICRVGGASRIVVEADEPL